MVPLFTQGCAVGMNWAWTMGALFIITKANTPTTMIDIVVKIAWFMTSYFKLYYLLNTSQEMLRK